MFVERGSREQNLKQAQEFFNKEQYEKANVVFSKIDIENNAWLQYFYGFH